MQAEAKLKAGGASAYASQLRLKNEDAVIAAVLAAAGLEVRVCVFVCVCVGGGVHLPREGEVGRAPASRG